VAAPDVEMAFRLPAPAVRPYVDRYVGYRLSGLSPRLHRGLPSPSVTLILSLDDPVDVAVMPRGSPRPRSFWGLVGGLHDAPVLIAEQGRSHGVHLELNPLGVRALLGMPAGELASSVLDVEDVLGPAGRELVERFAHARGWPQRFDVLDDVLGRRAREAWRPPAALARAWERLLASGGSLDVGALAAETGWSRRHLADRFRREVGLPPKATARVLRFQRSRRLLGGPRRPALADVALACGYYDQAHLARDWRELAGCSPTVWMAEELLPPAAELVSR
jgi:AraC-like DNA-binding protein